METTTPAAAHQPSFAALLESAIREPGRIHDGYFAFWHYSIGNQLLAVGQCAARGITPGPIATFAKWKEHRRHVKKGEKAIALCQPVTVKRTVEEIPGQPVEVAFTRFVFRPSWFVLAQKGGGAVDRGTFGPIGRSSRLVRLRHRLGIDAVARAQRLERSLQSLYCCSDGVSGRGAPVKYLSHSISLVVASILPPPHRGTKHLARADHLARPEAS